LVLGRPRGKPHDVLRTGKGSFDVTDLSIRPEAHPPREMLVERAFQSEGEEIGLDTTNLDRRQIR
jgi:hypothetical protein